MIIVAVTGKIRRKMQTDLQVFYDMIVCVLSISLLVSFELEIGANERGSSYFLGF